MEEVLRGVRWARPRNAGIGYMMTTSLSPQEEEEEKGGGEATCHQSVSFNRIPLPIMENQ